MSSAVASGQRNTFQASQQPTRPKSSQHTVHLATIDETTAPDLANEQAESCKFKPTSLTTTINTTMDDPPDIVTAKMATTDTTMQYPQYVKKILQRGAERNGPLLQLSTATHTHAARNAHAAVDSRNYNNSPSGTLGPKTSSLSSFLARIPESQKFSSTTLSSRHCLQSLPKPRPTVRVDRLEPTRSLQLSSHSVSISALKTILRSTNAQFRLALMLAVPWKTAAFWTVTGSTLGCFYVARLLLPRLRLYAVFLGRGLASLLAAEADKESNSPNSTVYQPLEDGQQLLDSKFSTPVQSAALRRVWVAVLTVVNSASSLTSQEDNNNNNNNNKNNNVNININHSASSSTSLTVSRSVANSTAAITSGVQIRPSTPRTISLPRTPERFSRYSPSDLWGRLVSSAMETLNGDESSMQVVPSTSTNSSSRIRSNSTQGRVHTKRFSLSFPVHAPNNLSSRPPSWHASPILSPEILASPTKGNFLTVLAAQERRVLELKEDLRRAEEELDRLKMHWAKHEVSKKAQNASRIQLQPPKTNLGSVSAVQEGDAQKVQQELERKRLLINAQRSSNRRMFSGSRHTRTLSLLSQDKGFDPQSFTDSPFKKTSRASLERSSTSPDLKPPPNRTKEDLFADLTGVPREAILRTGKQMVGDIKDGFWTFVEDIRQVTVGNEAVNGIQSAKMPARQNLIRSKSQRLPASHDRKLARNSVITSIQPRAGAQMTYDSPESSFWRENGVESPESSRFGPTVTTVRLANTPTPPQRQKDAYEAWDMWGTPIHLGNKHGASNSLSSTNTNATHHHNRSDSPSSATSDYEISKTATLSTGPSSPTTATTLSTPDMSSNSDGPVENSWLKPAKKFVETRSVKTTASALLPDWERAIAEESRKVDKQD